MRGDFKKISQLNGSTVVEPVLTQLNGKINYEKIEKIEKFHKVFKKIYLKGDRNEEHRDFAWPSVILKGCKIYLDPS